MKRILNTAGVLVFAAIIAAALPLTVPKLFGFQIYEVTSGSMEPELPVGSAVYLKQTDTSGIREGDIIGFHLREGSKTIATHRVIAIDKKTGAFTTKGDANDAQDARPVETDRVTGKVVFHIPVLGQLRELVKTPVGIAVTVILFAAGYACFVLAKKFE